MAHDEHAAVGDGADDVGHSGAALELDAVHPAFLVVLHRVLNSVVDAAVVGAERHVADHEGVGRAATHGLGVVHALLKGHGDGSRVAVNGHAEAVAHEQHVHAGFFGELGRGEIVGRHPHGLLAFFLHLLQVETGQFLLHVKNLLG